MTKPSFVPNNWQNKKMIPPPTNWNQVLLFSIKNPINVFQLTLIVIDYLFGMTSRFFY